MTLKRRRPVYRVEQTRLGTVKVYALRSTDDTYCLVAEYWDDGTYVYQYGRYGNSFQVNDFLARSGNTLMVGRGGLLATIRRQMRARVRSFEATARLEFNTEPLPEHIHGFELPWTAEEVAAMNAVENLG